MKTIETTEGQAGLTAEQLRTYDEDGFVGPLALCSPEEMKDIYDDLQRTVLADGRGLWMRHLDSRRLYDVCCRPGLLGPVAALLGPDLMVWRCRFIIKEPNAREIPWHQDAGYWKDLDPLINVSVWLALEPVDRGNACVRLIRGSHRGHTPHIDTPIGGHEDFALMADPTHIDERNAVYMELKAGEFFLFDAHALHGSSANESDRRRAGLSIRMTVPSVRVTSGAQSRPVLVQGEDRFGHNRLAEPPR
jgi:ectoine hydroxylase-related dioxygenase (phytanoyl-CoA dioxygenase family)